MRKKSKVKQDKPDFNVLIPKYSDDEILNILKKRKQYQPKAAEMAVQEAIKRGIIHSEQDLFAKEFQEVSVKKSIFPDVDDDANKKKITKSIARAFLISGIIPAIYGFVKINDGAFIEGIILSAGGFIWVFLAAQLLRNTSLKIIHSLFILVLISAVYVTKLIFSVPIVFIDIFIPVVIYILMVYGLLFLRRLI